MKSCPYVVVVVYCSGVVAEKSDHELFFFDKNSVLSEAASSEGE